MKKVFRFLLVMLIVITSAFLFASCNPDTTYKDNNDTTKDETPSEPENPATPDSAENEWKAAFDRSNVTATIDQTLSGVTHTVEYRFVNGSIYAGTDDNWEIVPNEHETSVTDCFDFSNDFSKFTEESGMFKASSIALDASIIGGEGATLTATNIVLIIADGRIINVTYELIVYMGSPYTVNVAVTFTDYNATIAPTITEEPETPDEPEITVDAEIQTALNGAGSIVVIVHDDGNMSTALYLADEFEKYDLRGTLALTTDQFFKNDSSGNRVQKTSTVEFWQEVLDTGRFSLSSHTRSHSYWGRTDDGDEGTYYLNSPDQATSYKTEPGRITAEVKGSQDDLRECFPDQRVLTFVKAGFGRNTDGSQITDEAMDIIKQYYITMRNTGGGVDTIPPKDSYNINSYMVENSDSSETLISYTDEAIAKGGMIVYLYHAISGSLRTETSELFAYISEMQAINKVWCATLEEASLYTEEYRTASVKATKKADAITVTLTDDLDNTVYDHALTIRIAITDADWDEVLQTNADGTTETLTVMTDDAGSYVYVNAVPDTGNIILTKAN